MAETALTIVIPTHGRSRSLAATLESLSRCDLPEEFVRTIIIENGSAEAESVARRYEIPLRAAYMHRPEGNKSAALNAAISVISGGLVVFLDDDIRVHADAIRGYAEGASKWGRGHFFGGSHEPVWEGTPRIDRSRYFPLSMMPFRIDHAEGEVVRHGFLGFNWAAWKEDLVRDGGFDPRHGPGSAYRATGQETEMQGRLIRAGLIPIHLPRCRVGHVISAKQTTWRWLLARSHRNGIAVGLSPHLQLFPLPHPLPKLILYYLVLAAKAVAGSLVDRGRRMEPLLHLYCAAGIIRGWVGSLRRRQPRERVAE